MQQYKKEFIEFMVNSDVLAFGDFTAKSGRKTPYFINTGKYRTGAQMQKLGAAYAQAIVHEFGPEFDVLFGPAYKGIPLVVATSIALQRSHRIDAALCFNRKEAKDHGEGGNLIGHQPVDGDRIIIVEDVTTAGTSIRETIPLLTDAANVKISGLIVSVDRKEKGSGEKSALCELAAEFDMRTTAIVTIDEIVEYLRNTAIDGKEVVSGEMEKRIIDYRKQYGVA
ncbi:MAG: orotate phosphoribosyltransferase [Chitinivibrionales bacterium]|nr:orotate phosphoribosyltransferase [Chitinivibrionales bacterium]